MYIEEAVSEKRKNGELVHVSNFKRAYEVKDKKVANITTGVLSKNGGLTEATFTTNISVAQLFDLVKQYDPEFKPVSDSEFKPVSM